MKKVKNNNLPKGRIDRGLFSTYLPRLFKFNRIRKLVLDKTKYDLK